MGILAKITRALHENSAGVTPLHLHKTEGVTPKPAPVLGCTRVTPVTPLKTLHQEQVQKSQQSACADTGLESMGLGDVPIAAPEPPAAQPAPDWQALHHAYMVHAMQCPQCKAAGKGERYGQRCIAGLELWQAYDATPYPYTHQKPRPDYNRPHGGKPND